MILKGGSRGTPKQLAYHLQRVDTNERVVILELKGALSDTLEGAFYDWQTMSEGTRGKRGLYHLNIDPHERYTMTPEQWARCVEVAEEELKLQGQPRAVVMHEKHGRQHIHVVWCRTDFEKCILKRDNNNYLAHERASKKLELEFGHEPVPGKHAKRDRQMQAEFPRAKFNHAEWQQAERGALDADERMRLIRALHSETANGQEFKKALEGAGFVLAQGDRGYMVVDPFGDHSVLSRNLKHLRKAGVDALMADVPLSELPTLEDAKELQKDRALKAREAEAAAAGQARPALSDLERREQITAIRKSCDDALAFKNALAESGYILAQGTKGGYVVVDGTGASFGLLNQLAEIKRKEYKAFMASVDLASLPTIEQTRALLREKAADAKKRAPEAGEISPQQASEKAPEPMPAPSPSKFLPDLKAPTETRTIEEREAAKKQAEQASKFLAPAAVPQKSTEVPPPAPAQPAAPQQPKEDPEIAAIRAAVEQRQAKEAQLLAERQAEELRRREYDLTIYNAGKIEDFDRLITEREAAMLRRQQAENRSGPKGLGQRIRDRFKKPAPDQARIEAQRIEREQLKARHHEERARYAAQIAEAKKLELENLRERQALERSDRARRNEEETERYIREQLEAKRLAQELEAERLRREMERTRSLEDGPEPPEPGKG